MQWVEIEARNAQFGDKRLKDRFIQLVRSISKYPNTSLPLASGSWNATKAAYRFFSNDRVHSNAIYETHQQATIERMRSYDVVLAVQDTTTFNFTSLKKTKGLGSIGKDGSFGFFLHTSMVVTTKGLPIGILARKSWAREAEKKNKAQNKTKPIEEKESYRWIELMEQSTKQVPPSTRVVMVGDRESDIVELFAYAKEHNHEFLVRATHNRKLENSDNLSLDEVKQAPVLGSVSVTIPRANGRKERKATLELRSTLVTIQVPRYKATSMESPVMTVIHAREVGVPKGEKPLEWFLLTSLPVQTSRDAFRYVTWYTYRWRIERYHYILKSGCQVEELQLETQERLEKAIAVYSIVAWRLLWLTYFPRQSPNEPCTIVLSEEEWKALSITIHRSPISPDEPPIIATAVRWIAQLGGFLGRKSDGEPGAKVLWRGLQRLQDLTLMWSTLRP
jgi:hypothetical protein